MGEFTRQSCVREGMLLERARRRGLRYFGRMVKADPSLRSIRVEDAASDVQHAAWLRLCRQPHIPDAWIIRRAIADVIRESLPSLQDFGDTAAVEPVDYAAAREARIRAELLDFLASLQEHQRLVAEHLASGETIPETAAAVGVSERTVNRIRAELVATYGN
jgi:hypothetical protein